jgi:hypothetical protein
MTSEKEAAANRRNAAKSTGPKSVEGKQVTRMNALKHGLQAEHVVIPGEDPEEFEALLRSLENDWQPVGARERLLVERIAYCTWRLQRASLIETAMMRKEHCSLAKNHAQEEMQRASKEMNWVQQIFDYGPEEDEFNEEGEEDSYIEHGFPEDHAAELNKRYNKAEAAYERARAIYDNAEETLKDSALSLDEVFFRSTNYLERLSRYETTIERRLRNAMQDLERFQIARKVEAAETATVIDISDMNQEER